ncbi:unnamed protein product, partial [Ectocarpus sp. 8 AP-2014]
MPRDSGHVRTSIDRRGTQNKTNSNNIKVTRQNTLAGIERLAAAAAAAAASVCAAGIIAGGAADLLLQDELGGLALAPRPPEEPVGILPPHVLAPVPRDRELLPALLPLQLQPLPRSVRLPADVPDHPLRRVALPQEEQSVAAVHFAVQAVGARGTGEGEEG